MLNFAKAFKAIVLQVEYLTGSLAKAKVFGKVHNIPRCLKDLSDMLDDLFSSAGNMQPMVMMD